MPAGVLATRVITAAAVAFGVATAFAAPASAGTARVVYRFEPGNDGTEELHSKVAFVAGPGESNQVALEDAGEVEPEDNLYYRTRVTDSSTPIRAGESCSQEGPHSVLCTSTGFPDSGSATLGDRDDALRMAHGGVVAEGGAGDDLLIGSQSADRLDGGPGTDVIQGLRGNDVLRDSGGGERDLLDGGGGTQPSDGIDTLDLSGRREDLRIDLARGVAGERGERDRVRSIENVVPGRGDDVVIGTRGRNVFEERLGAHNEGSNSWTPTERSGDDRFHGGGGRDGMTSLGGLDRLVGGGDRDVLICHEALTQRCRIRGGAGDDSLSGSGGRDELWGGAGADTIIGKGGDDRLAGGAGRDTMFGNQGRDLLLARDGGRDRVAGGRGRDRARVDRAVDLLRGVEALF